jgi:hypothetical protein
MHTTDIRRAAFFVLAGIVLTGAGASRLMGQATARPIPYPVTPPARYLTAIENGTRTPNGAPGAEYWQQYATYDIDVRVEPASKRLDGQSTIVYQNNSPDQLTSLVVKLYMNLHAEGVQRNRPAEVTGGVELQRVAVGGETLEAIPMRYGPRRDSGPGYTVMGTVMLITLAEPLPSGGSATLEIDWGYTIPRSGAGGRMGWQGENLFYLAYWYPTMATYDDVVGWHTDPFWGQAEFYSGFADYDVRIDVPDGWVVAGTGELVNAEDVLPPAIRERLAEAAESDEAVHVITAADFGPGNATLTSDAGRLTWHKKAERVRDFAFSVTSESVWAAARTPVGDLDGDGQTDYTDIHALYRTSAQGWGQVVQYAQHAITFFSEYLDYPYPWPHMTSIEGRGLMGGGMEYPMMTLMGGASYGLTNHELGHMWLPMIVDTDEVRWAWMDEGVTSYNSTQARPDFLPPRQARGGNQVAQAAARGTIMRWTDWQGPQEGFSAYGKPAAALTSLRAVLGPDLFDRALRQYVDYWAFKQPKPWDFFQTFNDVTGKDLDWFWRGWFYEDWTMDHAIASVEETASGTRITIEDRDNLVMPAFLTVTREDGSEEIHQVSHEVWLSGQTTAVVEVPRGSRVARVQLDAEFAFPDRDRSNDVWEMEN